ARLGRKDENIGSHPDFDCESQPTGGLTERLCDRIGNFDVIPRIRSVERDRGVRIVQNGAWLAQRRVAKKCPVEAVARSIKSTGSSPSPQTPVTNRAFCENDVTVAIARHSRSFMAVRNAIADRLFAHSDLMATQRVRTAGSRAACGRTGPYR